MKEVKEKYLKEIYLNILKAIIIVLYFFILNLSYENINNEHLIELGIQIFTMIFLFIAIYIFEKAYKKDDDNLAIQGIEILILSAYTLTSRHITNKFSFEFKSYSLVASYIFAIYFILKSIVIYTKGRKEEVENLSDIRELVKKDEPVIKEATKKTKEENTNVKDIQTEEKNKTKTTKKSTSSKKTTTTKGTASKKGTAKKEETAKKSTATKKSTAKKEETVKKSTATKKSTAKKETTTKKATTKRNYNKKTENKEQKIEDNKKEQPKDKKIKDEKQEEKPKRKRVKKEVKEND